MQQVSIKTYNVMNEVILLLPLLMSPAHTANSQSPVTMAQVCQQ